MRALFVLSIVLAMFIALSSGAAAALDDMSVRDASGEVVLQDASAIDIPELVGYLVKGGVEGGYAHGILVSFGSESVPELLKVLDGSGDGFSRVLSALVSIKDKRAVEPISKYINDPDGVTANNAKGALRAYGELAVPVLAGLLKDANYRKAAVDVLEYITPSADALKLVRPLTKSDVPEERAAAAYVLGVWKDLEWAGEIQRLMGDTDAAVRLGALRGYEAVYMGKPQKYDTKTLLGLLGDPSADVRAKAASVLSLAPTEEAVDAAIERMKVEDDVNAKANIIDILESSGNDKAVLPLLEEMGKENDKMVQSGVIWALGELKAKEAVPYILEPFETGGEVPYYIQQESFMALEKIGEPVDVKQLLKYLKHGDKFTTGTKQLLDLLASMARPGDDEVISAVERYAQEETDAFLHDKALQTLEKLR